MSEERRERILREVSLRGRINVAEFAERHGFSGMTIRRDLAVLADRGLLRRIHGGAIAAAEGAATGDRGLGTGAGPIATVGLIVPDATYYFPQVIRGVSVAARQSGLRLVLGVTNYEPREEIRQLTKLSDSGVGAIMLVTARPGIDEARTWDCLARVRPPVVLVERSLENAPTSLRMDAVRSDHSYGAELAVAHLVDAGHRRIGLICRESATAPWIEQGYERAVSRLGLPEDAPRMRAPSPRWGNESAAGSLRDFLDRCLASDTRAAIVLPDELGINLLSLVEESGLRVPQDFSIVTYDDEVAGLASVPLTSVAPPKDAVGRRALTTCLMRIEERERSPAQRVELVPELRVRESTA
ncbi:substrate-binding domain-containing protein [Microbacterium sp. BWT-B31]|uniref:LacI family DNA-binding transcriptional regulator n=1 Tax=Microbacterium sp. BWT-B31 TaxID=3232072 RepID=UPI003527795C